jgi:hypothetical protein
VLFSRECAISQDSRFGNLSRLLNFTVDIRIRSDILNLSTKRLLVLNRTRSRKNDPYESN